MPAWVTIAVTVAIAVVGFGLQFYFKIFTDPRDIKRHLNRGKEILLNILFLGVQAVWLLYLASKPITNERIGLIALDAAGLAYSAATITMTWAITRIVGVMSRGSDISERQTEQIGSLIGLTDRHLESTRVHSEIIKVLIGTVPLAPETIKTLLAKLNSVEARETRSAVAQSESGSQQVQ